MTVSPLLEHPGSGGMRLEEAIRAAREMLVALGVPVESEHLRETPRRLVQAYAEMLGPVPFEMTTFPNDEQYDELVVVSDIPVRSVCEHHLLPFVGIAHVGYLPAERIAGLSKLARTVDQFARRPQTQERLTTQVADHLQACLSPHGVGVVIEAEHTCMTVRGALAHGSRTVTARFLGRARTDPACRAEFMALTHEPKEYR